METRLQIVHRILIVAVLLLLGGRKGKAASGTTESLRRKEI